MKKLLILLVISVMLLATACSNNSEENLPTDNETTTDNSQNQDNDNQSAKEEEPIIAPDFELQDLNGNMVKLSDFLGKKVMINFWATWCGFCVQEMPDFMKLQDAHKDDLVILFVNVGEKKEDVLKFVEKEKISGTILLDTDQKVATKYGVRSFPSTLALNEKGEIVTARVGMMDYSTMEKMYDVIK